jgi:hypothetical protein
MRVVIEAAIEEDAIEEFLTLIRDFDRAHPNGLIRLLSLDGSMTVDEVSQMMQRLEMPHLAVRSQ